MQVASHDDVDELRKLYDRLNLTGRVTRVGQHALLGGCAYIWEARLTPLRTTTTRRSRTVEEGEKVAVKVIREIGSSASEECLKKRLIREIRAWSTLHHRNVLPLLGFTYGFNADSRLASLVSPWMPNGTARKYLERRSVSERIRILTGVADGLCYLHRHDVVHGDLKGDNIMIDMNFEPKIVDFGLSKLLDEITSTLTNTGSLAGSVRWIAPELIHQPGVNFETDVWAFGMTILELFTNTLPFRGFNDAQVILKLSKGEVPTRPHFSFGMDDALWDLCCDCWNLDRRLRPSSRVIAKRLWDFDLKCKLAASNKKRRAPPSPERKLYQHGEGRKDGEHQRQDGESRVRKSPKYSGLAEIHGDSLPSPGTSIPIHRAGMRRSPGPRTPARSTSSRAVSFSSSSSSRSQRDSRSDLANNFDPRRLLPNQNSMSDGELFASLHNHPPAPMIRRSQTEPTALDLFLDDQTFNSGMGPGSDSSLVLSTPRQNAGMLHSSFGTPAHAHAWAMHDAYAYAYGHATPPNGYALPQSAAAYAVPMNGTMNGLDTMNGFMGLPAPDYSTPPTGYAALPNAFSTPPNALSTPPQSATYAQLYPQFDMQSDQHQLPLMGTNSDLELLLQTQYLSGFDTDAIHSGPLIPADALYRRAAYMSTFPYHMQARSGPLFHQGALDIDMGPQALGLGFDQYSPLLLPPPPLPSEGDSFGSGYSVSPSLSDNGLPSPHALGQLFSENFQYHPHAVPPTNASPLFLNEPLFSSPPPLHQDLRHSHFNNLPPPQQPSSLGIVDFESLQRGVISPALSDISNPDTSNVGSHLDSTPSLFSTPPISGFEDVFAFEDEGEGEQLDGSLALIGGLGLDVSDDFNIAASEHVHHVARHIGTTRSSGGRSAGPSDRIRGQGHGRDGVQGPAPTGEHEEGSNAEQTPPGSPRQLGFSVPLSRHTEQVPGTGASAAGNEAGQVQMPPTPRLSPFPPSIS